MNKVVIKKGKVVNGVFDKNIGSRNRSHSHYF